ncbi:MAG: hypothetical protein B6I31_00380 [Desulfobacteraceae bacterium 4572_19]|nr:MAG: hypothetical protein B6I31_00380 [Desulfobacteraceae bacterium 4572_19]
MLLKKVVVVNEFGIHSRPASMLATIADKAKLPVWLSKEGTKRVDASSIIDILTCECTEGTEVIIEIEDKVDTEILNEISNLIKRGFEE